MIGSKTGLVADVQSTFRLLKEQRKEEAAMLFKLGKTYNTGNAGLTIAALAEQSGVSKNRLKMCSKLATALNNDYDLFVEEFDKIELATFDKLYSKFVTQKTRKRSTAAEHIKNVLRQLEEELNDADTRYCAMEAMRNLRRRISNKLALDPTIADAEYIKYYECCSCGLYPPPDEGFEIVRAKDIAVPICDNCYAKSNTIDMTRVAIMYSNYSMQLSRLILAGTINLSDEDLYEESLDL